jgi:hypothetical protein
LNDLAASEKNPKGVLWIRLVNPALVAAKPVAEGVFSPIVGPEQLGFSDPRCHGLDTANGSASVSEALDGGEQFKACRRGSRTAGQQDI